MREAISLERAAMAGFVRPGTEVDELVRSLGGSLRAVLRDVLCGHLDPALRRVADDLRGVEEVPAHAPQAVEVVDVVLEFGDDDRRRIAQALAQPCHVHRVARRERAQLGGRDGHVLGQRGAEVGGDGGRKYILLVAGGRG